jgi:hypothetical protein
MSTVVESLEVTDHAIVALVLAAALQQALLRCNYLVRGIDIRCKQKRPSFHCDGVP